MGPHELLEKVAKVFESLGIDYVVTGAIASIFYGEPRLTNDIDIVASIEKKDIPGLIEAFPENEFYVEREQVEEAVEKCRQFNIIHPASALKIDIMIKKDTPFDKSRFSRARMISPAGSYKARFASPEDVIIKKMDFFKRGGSEKHLRDIAGMIRVSGSELDLDYISRWADRLGLTEIWEEITKKTGKK